MYSKAPVNASALRQPGFREAAIQVTAARAQSHIEHYTRSFRTRLPDRMVADGSVCQSMSSFNQPTRSAWAVRPASLAASARWRVLEQMQCQALSRSKSCTLGASSRRNAPMQARTKVNRKLVSQAQLRGSAMCRVGSSARQATQLVFLQPPNPSIEGTLSGLRPPSAPHVKR